MSQDVSEPAAAPVPIESPPPAAQPSRESEPDPRPEDAATHVYSADHPLPDGTRA